MKNQITYHEEHVFTHNEFILTNFIVISGPSGGGKTTLCNSMQQNVSNVNLLVKRTDRLKREGEENGIDYFFVKRD